MKKIITRQDLKKMIREEVSNIARSADGLNPDDNAISLNYYTDEINASLVSIREYTLKISNEYYSGRKDNIKDVEKFIKDVQKEIDELEKLVKKAKNEKK